MSLPELPEPDLLVDCAQSFVQGWTRHKVAAYGEECVKAKTGEFRAVLQELRLRLHASGRRPEECYEMSLIDEALA
jgi:hypothetical protein